MGEPEPTPAQLAACGRAMDGLEAQADIWADEVDLVVIVKQIGAVSRGLTDRMPKEIREGFIHRQEANVDAIARQAYLEGFYRGGESRKAHDEARIEALVKALHDIIAANNEFRKDMPDDWEGDPLQDACHEAAKLLLALK